MTYKDQVIADGAIAYWRLDELSGTTAVDIIGGNNGTISGGVTLGQTGALADGNKAMAFDGSSGKIAVPNGAYKQFGTGPLTIEAWAKPTVTPSFQQVFDVANDGDASIAGVLITANGTQYSAEVHPGGGTAGNSVSVP